MGIPPPPGIVWGCPKPPQKCQMGISFLQAGVAAVELRQWLGVQLGSQERPIPHGTGHFFGGWVWQANATLP